MRRLLILFSFAFFISTADAQLSQLEFDDDEVVASSSAASSSAASSVAPEELLKQIIEEDVKVPQTAAEAEAMEKAALEKLKNKGNSSSLYSVASSVEVITSSSSSSVSSEQVEKFNFSGGLVALGPQHGCAFIPPRLKGPYVDQGNDSAITSKESWPIPKNKDCASLADEKSYISKALALREILFRFSGNSDYTDLASTKVCHSHCEAGFHLAVASDLKLDQSGGAPNANFSVAVVGDSCHYILEKPKDKSWKLIKALGLVCNCFESSRAKPIFDSQVLESK